MDGETDWRTDRRTDIPAANAPLNYVARPKINDKT